MKDNFLVKNTIAHRGIFDNKVTTNTNTYAQMRSMALYAIETTELVDEDGSIIAL